jgi:oxalate decarboxylase/phosphoglucose isomerase-like protein (cupin superfamily)
MSVTRYVVAAVVVAACISCLPVEPDMAQSLKDGPPNFVEPECQSTIKFNNVSWAQGAADISAGLLEFKCQGTVRQLHWHPYADEWAYVVKGSFVVTVTGPENDPWPMSVSRASAGSVWFFPKGWWHIILCETDECELILAFNNKAFIGQDDLDFVQAMQTLPPPIAAATMGVSQQEWETRILPSLERNSFSEKNALSVSPKGSCDAAAQTCTLPAPITTFEPSVETWEDRGIARRFEGIMPNKCKGGEHFGVDLSDIRASNFPFLDSIMSKRAAKRNSDHGMSGQRMILQPGATRPPVWITNANAVLYVVEGGPVEVTVYGGPTTTSKKTTYNESLTAGSIIYIPITSMYLVHNPSCDANATVTLIFDHPSWEEQEMTKLSLFPRYAVAASLNLNYTPGYA